MKKISLKSQRKMEQDAARGKWYNLVELRRVPELAAWLCDDFSVVASDDGEKADVASISKDKPVELNQYNVQAYKQVLHTVEVSPDIDGGRGVAEVGYSVSHKVSRDGKYLGVGASYNFDNDKAYVKMTYTW